MKKRERKDYLYGIDISGWNKAYSYEQIAKSVDFAYIKATEGKTNKSKTYHKHTQGLLDYGIPVGPYHFAWLKKHGINEPVKQAKWFVKQVGPLNSDSLIPVLDIESGWYAPLKKIVWWVNQWLEVVENELGAMVMIYTFRNYWKYKLKEVWDRPLWLASVGPIGLDNKPLRDRPKKPIPEWDYTLWQYSHKGKISGLKGSVDLNRLHRNDLTNIMVERMAVC